MKARPDHYLGGRYIHTAAGFWVSVAAEVLLVHSKLDYQDLSI